MQNRRIIDGVFRAIGRQPRPAFETNSLINLFAQIGGWSSIVPQPLLGALELPAGVSALPLTDPDVRRLVGLVAPDRDPPSPLAMALFNAASDPLRG